MRKQLEQLRDLMLRENVDVYLITMEDDHQSEYVCAYFREIAEISGFTGSAGSLVVTKEDAGLWTDGRYFVQAANQLEGSGIKLMKSGQEGTPLIEEYILAHMPDGGTLGFNGKCVSYTEAKRILRKLKRKHLKVSFQADLPDLLWENRPDKVCKPCFVLEEAYTGMSCRAKLAAIREQMVQEDASVHILSTLDDIGWILNMRGNDILCNPVFSAFLLIDLEKTVLYTDEGHLTSGVSDYLRENEIQVKPEQDIYEDIQKLHSESILIEEARVSYSIMKSLPDSAEIINRIAPSSLMKCYKNKVEMENLKKAHLKDGVAVTRFLYWFEHNVGKIPLNEWDAVQKIEQLRREQAGFIENSFTTIAAYGPNAAMCHYAPTADSCSCIEPHGLFLLDSGGHYLEGTTDITRTWSCGPTTEEERLHYTYTVMSHLRLSDVTFLEGASGMSIDYAAREIFWKHHLNFNHGTGHGVGYVLNVHERPVGIRYKIVSERMDSYVLKEGAFVSNEPGIYIADSHGIRIENLMMCMNDVKNEYGQFMRFENYTLCPIETDILCKEIMSDRDLELLNAYNQKVYDSLAAFMSQEERIWLQKVCAAVER